MALTIKLAPEVEQAIIAEAAEMGTTPELLIAQRISSLFPVSQPVPTPPYPPGSLAEYWTDYIGAIDSSEHTPGGAQMSVNSDQKFMDILLEKQKQGTL